MTKIFITGGSGGLGSALVPYFAGKNFGIIYTGHDAPLNGLSEQVMFVPWDMTPTSTTGLLKTLRSHGYFDAWIHAVGGYWGGSSLAESPAEKVLTQMRLNFESAVQIAPTIIELLKHTDYGRIIFMGGLAGLYAQPGNGAYGASKAALTHYFRTLSAELRDSKIRTAMLVPSIIDTPANRQAMPDANFGEWVSPTQIAEICEFLISPTASAVHNSILELV